MMATEEMQVKVEKKGGREEEERTHADTYIADNQSINAKNHHHQMKSMYMGFHQTAARAAMRDATRRRLRRRRRG